MINTFALAEEKLVVKVITMDVGDTIESSYIYIDYADTQTANGTEDGKCDDKN